MTSETKFTPGPWKFIDATKVASMQYSPKCVIKSGNKLIASFSWNDLSPFFPAKGESQANAHLISAAPDMYEALASAIDLVERDVIRVRPSEREELMSALEAWNTALAKARGEA